MNRVLAKINLQFIIYDERLWEHVSFQSVKGGATENIQKLDGEVWKKTEDNIFLHLWGMGVLSGEATLSKLICFPSDKRFSPKVKYLMANSADPDQLAS